VPPSIWERIASRLEARKYLVLAGLTVVYGIGVVGQAQSRPLWYDEIYLLMAAKAPTLGAVWNLAVATDANPPLPHVVTHLVIGWFGINEVSVRLPAMVGFWIFCLCLFQFVRHRKGALFGFSALLLPILTDAFGYATEARAYGVELAFCGVVLIAWQAAAEARRRAAALALLALGIAGMLFCHYYGILVYLPLAGGELVRARRARKIDWGVAAAMAAGILPLAVRILVALQIGKDFAHGWAAAYLRQGIEFWQTALSRGAPYLALLAFLAAFVAIRKRYPAVAEDPMPVPAHEWVAGAFFLLIPLAGVLAGVFVTHAFTPRYVLIGLTGFCILAPMLVAEYCGARSPVGVLMAAVLAWGAVLTLIDHKEPRNPFTDETALAQALEQGPVVISDGQLHLQMWHYAPDRLKPRLVFLVDRAAAVKYMGFDTLERGGEALRTWAGATAPDYAEFAKPGREFLLYRNLNRPEWVTPRLLDDGASMEVRSVGLGREMVKVRLK
jgi:hypothetical protein